MHNSHKILLLSICCATAITLVAEYCVADEEYAAEQKTYNVKTDVICKKESGKTYCTDKSGTPLNGEMVKYENGVIVRRYPMKDGYLNGTGMVYYDSGRMKQSLEYKEGVLNGSVKSYNRAGAVMENTPYVDGKKEGVAVHKNATNIMKMIYINNEMNGDYQIWNADGSKKIYDLKMAQDAILSGTYYHYEKEGSTCSKEKVASIKIPELVIEGVNEHCLAWQPELTCSACPVIAVGSHPECNQEWRKAHRKEIIQYFISCRCPALSDGSLVEGSEEYMKYKKDCANE